MSDQITARIVADSIATHGVRLTTLELKYPRFIHAELLTHRVFSRSSSSSRAIPVKRMLEQVRNDPAMPVHWGQNQAGMQARSEVQHVGAAIDQWRRAARNAADLAEEMAAIGLHKQVANRVLEPFQFMHTVVTATEWDNFFLLRDHPDAQPEIQALAIAMRAAMAASQPRPMPQGVWHLPYVAPHELADGLSPEEALRCSAARCARVSYLNHDGSQPDVDKDLALFDRLVGSEPLHASPTEHQATPALSATTWSGNFRGWVQFRKTLRGG